MTVSQQIITVALIILGTVITRFTPYIAFPEGRPVPRYIQYLGKVLAPAVFGLLVVYCLRNIDWLTALSAGGTHGIPEILGVTVTALIFLWKRNMLLSMAAGTVLYMFLVQVIF